MEIDLEEKANEVLGRTEVSFTVEHDGESTPGRTEVRKKLAALKDADEELVLVRRMDTEYGMPVTHGEATIYDDEQEMREVENDYVIERNLGEA